MKPTASKQSSLFHLDTKALLELLLALISHNSGARTLLLHCPAMFDQLRPQGCTQRPSQVWTTLGPIGTSEGETAAKASHGSQIQPELSKDFFPSRTQFNIATPCGRGGNGSLVE